MFILEINTENLIIRYTIVIEKSKFRLRTA